MLGHSYASRGVAMADAKTKVFLSYSRKDSEFAEDLNQALDACGFEAYLDKHDIAAGERWEDRLGRLIEAADTVVFVISPDSVASERCEWEVQKAETLGKRLLTVVWRAVGEAETPDRLKRLNYIFFSGKERSFARGLADVVKALNTDLDWIREHTRLGELAARWESRGRPEALLLHGDDIATAKAWVSRRPKDAPEPALLQRELVAASEKAEAARSRTAEEQKARARRLWRGIIASAAAAAVMVGLAGFAYVQWKRAEEQKGVAQQQRDEGLIIQSRYLADLSRRQTSDGDAATGILYALEGLKDEASALDKQRARPFWQGSRNALLQGILALKEEHVWNLPEFAQGETGLIGAMPSPDGTKLLIGANGAVGVVVLAVDVGTGETKELYKATAGETVATTIAFSADGKRAAVVFSGDTRIIDLETGRELRAIAGSGAPIDLVRLSRDGRRLLTVAQNEPAKVYAPEIGLAVYSLAGNTSPIGAAAFSPDGTLLLTGSEDQTARVFDAATGTETAVLKGHVGSVTGVAFSGDGTFVATAADDKTLRLWNAGSWTEIAQADMDQDGVREIAFSRDNKLVLTGGEDGSIAVWSAEDGRHVARLRGHSGSVRSAAFSGDATSVISASADGSLRVWHVAASSEGARVLASPQGGSFYDASFSPDGARVVTASLDQKARVWNAADGSLLLTLTGHEAEVTSAVFSPDGKRILTASADKTAIVWSAETGQKILVLSGHKAPVRMARFSPDGSLIATAGGYVLSGRRKRDHSARIWSAATGAQVRILDGHGQTVRSIAFSHDGKKILTASFDGTARLWDLATGAALKRFQMTNRGNLCISAAFSPDDMLIATGSSDHLIRVFDARSGEVVKILPGHASLVQSVTFSPDGKILASASGSRRSNPDEDAAVRLWSTVTWEPLAVLDGHRFATWSVAFSPDGGRIASASSDGTARLWNTRLAVLAAGELIKLAKSVVPRCLTRSQRDQAYLEVDLPAWCRELSKWPRGASTEAAAAQE